MGVISVIVFIHLYVIQMLNRSGIHLFMNETFELFTNQLLLFQYIPFIWPAIIIGGSIIITLIYVSWRKYKGLKKERKRDFYN